MKLTNTLLKLAAAAAAVAGIAFLVYKNIDKITAWLEKLCPCKCVPETVEVPEEPVAEETVEVAEEPVAEETDFAEEAPAAEEETQEPEQAAEIPEGEPVAEEDDFAE